MASYRRPWRFTAQTRRKLRNSPAWEALVRPFGKTGTGTFDLRRLLQHFRRKRGPVGGGIDRIDPPLPSFLPIGIGNAPRLAAEGKQISTEGFAVPVPRSPAGRTVTCSTRLRICLGASLAPSAKRFAKALHSPWWARQLRRWTRESPRSSPLAPFSCWPARPQPTRDRGKASSGTPHRPQVSLSRLCGCRGNRTGLRYICAGVARLGRVVPQRSAAGPGCPACAGWAGAHAADHSARFTSATTSVRTSR